MSSENRLVRIQEILARREELIPLLDPANVITRDKAAVFRQMEEQAAMDVTSELKIIVAPYATTIHAMIADKLHHPEDILVRDKDKRIQFSMVSSDPDFITLVTMKLQQIKMSEKKELICKEVVFGEIPTSCFTPFTENFIDVRFLNQLCTIYTGTIIYLNFLNILLQ